MRIIIVLGLFALAACEAGENKASDGDVATSSENETTLPPSDQPASSSAEVAAVPPVAMPEFAPQYPGSAIKAVNNSQAAGGNVHEVTLATEDDAARIMDFYREKFLAAGLKKTSEFQSGGTGVLSAAAGSRKASIAIMKNGAKNSVIVTYSDD